SGSWKLAPFRVVPYTETGFRIRYSIEARWALSTLRGGDDAGRLRQRRGLRRRSGGPTGAPVARRSHVRGRLVGLRRGAGGRAAGRLPGRHRLPRVRQQTDPRPARRGTAGPPAPADVPAARLRLAQGRPRRRALRVAGLVSVPVPR